MTFETLYTSNVLENLQTFLFIELYVLIFSMLQIKTKIYLFTYFKITINLLHGSINNIFFKNNISHRNIVKRLSSFYIFANPFKVWLNRKQLDVHRCFINLISHHSDNIIPYHVASGKLSCAFMRK